MILGGKGVDKEELEVQRAAREAARIVDNASKASSQPAPLSREGTAAHAEKLADGVGSPPVADALRAVAKYARGEWPEDDELPRIQQLSNDLAGIDKVHEALNEEALARVAEVESARQQVMNDLTKLVSATGAADETSVGRLALRIDALETHLSNMQLKVDRGPHSTVGRMSDDSAELRGRLARVEAENSVLRRRMEAIESQVAHLERILEAAAGFAAQEQQQQQQAQPSGSSS